MLRLAQMGAQGRHRAGQVLHRRGELRRRRVGKVVDAAIVPEGALAADEGEAQFALAGPRVDDLQKPHLPRGGGVRAAAGHVLKIADGDDADVLFHRGRLAQGHASKRLLVRERANDGHVALYVFIDGILERAQFFLGDARAAVGEVGVDARHLRAQVQADDVAAELPPDGVGQHVLAAVLLHVVEAARPVDLAVNFASHAQGRVHAVEHVAVLHEHIKDVRPAQRARIVGLAAGGGIKGRAVEADEICVLVGGAIRHPRVEGSQVGIVIVKALCHAVHLLHPS